MKSRRLKEHHYIYFKDPDLSSPSHPHTARANHLYDAPSYSAWICFTVGKRLVKNEGDIRKHMKMPNKYDVLGLVTKNYGYTRMNVKCQDGETRICRVRGKMKKRNWVREGDTVLVSPWEFQSDQKGDIIFRYTRNQSNWLQSNGYLNVE
jgi:translation initiation factor 1A